MPTSPTASGACARPRRTWSARRPRACATRSSACKTTSSASTSPACRPAGRPGERAALPSASPTLAPPANPARASTPGPGANGDRKRAVSQRQSQSQINTGTIYVDADACPVKQETYKVAERHGWTMQVVANDIIALPVHPLIKRMVVGGGFDAADDWIAERAGLGDVVITADIPLAARWVKAGSSEGHTSDLQSLMRFSYAVFCQQ